MATYHPTFLYEALWNLALAGLIVLLGRRLRLRPGQLFVVYIAGYAAGRLWVEALRIDPATEVLGVRVNILVSGAVLLLALVVLVVRSRSASPPDHAAGADASGPDGSPQPVEQPEPEGAGRTFDPGPTSPDR